MLELIAENLAPIMFLALVVFLLLGYPVAFSLCAVGLIFFVVGVELAPYSEGVVNLSWPLLYTLPERIYGVMSNDTLLAIPFFAFMGLILERSGMAEDLLETVGQLFGTVRGGLAYAVIFVGALLAATTGVVAASVISMGLISLPIMLRYGYDARFAAGVIAASGTLAQIIPPSLVLIVLADQLGRSVGDMYTGALVPGLDARRLLCRVRVHRVDDLEGGGAGSAAGGIVHREPDGSRGYASLVVLTAVCGSVRLDADAADDLRGRRLHHPDPGLAVSIAIVVAGLSWIVAALRRTAAAVAAGRAGDVRDGAAAAADIPGPRHDLHRHGHPDRGRRHGCRRRHAAGARQAPQRRQPGRFSFASCARRRRPRPSCRRS